MCLVGGLVGVLSCALKKMPDGELVSVEYTRSGTMAGYVYEGHVERDSTGAFVLRAMKENYGPLFEKKLDVATMRKFRQIIEEEKMYEVLYEVTLDLQYEDEDGSEEPESEE